MKIKGWKVVPVNEPVKIRNVNVIIGGVMGNDGRTIPTKIEYKWKNRSTILFIRSYSGKKFELSFRTPHGYYTLGDYKRDDLAFDKAVAWMKLKPFGATNR